MITSNIVFLIIITSLISVISAGIYAYRLGHEIGTAEGKISVASGKVKLKLVRQHDGSFEWEEIE